MEDLLLELKYFYGNTAEFREGQAEAIQAVLDRKRILVVQKTGWGKSLVYFLATKMLRKKSKGITLIISPLLALMNNQITSADRLNLNVKTINSSNIDEWKSILEEVEQDRVDALIISPERLSNSEFKNWLREYLAARINLFVVDEAHCISDWGHDFRPDYRRIVDVIHMLPRNISVLATTATASARVVSDIKAQLGEDLLVSRGGLMRDTLAIQVLTLDTKEERLAWMIEHIHELPGTGIVYCLTINDCKLVNKWLNANGIPCMSYYSEVNEGEKELVVDSFMNNKIKVLVATVAFGMGYDKPDIGFVIHFQKPANVVAYYQQIGRAGRAIDQALAILLCGVEDDEINNYFIESAFPTENIMTEVIDVITRYPGIRIRTLEKYINMKRTKIEQCVKYLLVKGDIYEEKGQYYKTPRGWVADLEKSEQITKIRRNELKQMNLYTQIKSCYMEFIAKELDDTTAKRCGRCSNCLETDIVSIGVAPELITKAQQFIKKDFNIIKPRKKWPESVRVDEKNAIAVEFLCEEGRVLSNYGDAGWGKMVSEGKYLHGYFDEQLVEASYELLKDFVLENEIKWVTSVPSKRRPNLVKDFAIRIAERLGITYREALEKVQDVRCQKELNTNYYQFQNANDSFEVTQVIGENVLLVDDMVDSKWTLTTCGYKLRKAGSGRVFPYALANSAGRNGEE